MQHNSILLRFQRVIVTAALPLGAVLLLVSCGNLGTSDPSPACPVVVGRGIWDLGSLVGADAKPLSTEMRKLLESPNFGAAPQATDDLEAGIVDQRLIATLRILSEEHRICVETFKEGHYFLRGDQDGPRIPKGYGKAGGLPNTHYFGRAADVCWVDGKPVEGNATNPDVLKLGKLLASIPPRRRPDQIMGPKVGPGLWVMGARGAGSWHPTNSSCTRITSTSAIWMSKLPTTLDEH